MKKIIILDIIGTPNAIITAFGVQIFQILKPEIDVGNKVILSFEGLKHCNSHFLNPSVGELYLIFGEKLKELLIFEDLENQCWKNIILDFEKI